MVWISRDSSTGTRQKNGSLQRGIAGNAGAGILLPSRIFQDRKVSVLEAIVEYMKDSMGMSYHEIAVMLNRNDRTVWTCYQRAKQKRKLGEEKGKEADGFK